MINIGYVSGLLPVTGIPLPFISAGGTSLLDHVLRARHAGVVRPPRAGRGQGRPPRGTHGPPHPARAVVPASRCRSSTHRPSDAASGPAARSPPGRRRRRPDADRRRPAGVPPPRSRAPSGGRSVIGPRGRARPVGWRRDRSPHRGGRWRHGRAHRAGDEPGRRRAPARPVGRDHRARYGEGPGHHAHPGRAATRSNSCRRCRCRAGWAATCSARPAGCARRCSAASDSPAARAGRGRRRLRRLRRRARLPGRAPAQPADRRARGERQARHGQPRRGPDDHRTSSPRPRRQAAARDGRSASRCARRSRSSTAPRCATRRGRGSACDPTCRRCWCSAARRGRGRSTGRRLARRAGLRAAGVQVLHVIGPKNTLEVASDPATPYVVVPYVEEMQYAYAAADFALCRCGAMTCAELAAVGLPAAYVPYPVGNGEQRFNADADRRRRRRAARRRRRRSPPTGCCARSCRASPTPRPSRRCPRHAEQTGARDADVVLAGRVLTVAAEYRRFAP